VGGASFRWLASRATRLASAGRPGKRPGLLEEADRRLR
jgi:hypothetical protein